MEVTKKADNADDTAAASIQEPGESGDRLLVCSTYLPGNAPDSTTQLLPLMDHVEKQKNQIITGSDYNYHHTGWSRTDTNSRGPSWGVRHVQTFLLFLAMMLAYSMRVNMSLAIVAMTGPTSDNSFEWNIQTQSLVLSSFFWGYVVMQIPAGELAARYGGAILITICIVVNSAVSLIIPTAAYYGGWKLLCACRVLQGLSQGFLFPSTHNILGKWIPLDEKSRWGTFIYIGSQLGIALQLVSSGFITNSWGWQAIFYVNGIPGMLWTVAYIYLGAASPESSKKISAEERLYIQTSLGHVGGHKKLKTPWKSIWTSLPFITLIVAHCGQNWGFWTLITEMPSYMSKVLGVNIKANGVMSALPYLAIYICSLPMGFFSDYVLKKQWLSTSVCRKVNNSLGYYAPALALIGLSYAPAGNVTLVVALFTIVVALNAGHFTGYMLVHIDMAPNFAGQMMGITNLFANIISSIAPLTAGAILKDETDPNEWRKVFFLTSAVYVVTNTIYLIFGTSERQKWKDDSETNETKQMSNKSPELQA